MKIKKIDSNNYEVTEDSVRNVDKKILKKEIAEIKDLIEKKKEQVGIIALEKDLEGKETLLAALK